MLCNIVFVASLGQEAAGPRAKDQGRGAAAAGKVRAGVDRDQQVQSGVHRGHELSIHQVPRDGGDATALLQGGPLQHPQGAQSDAEPEPAADLRGVLSHGQQRGPPEGPQVVVQQPRRQYGHGLAGICGKYYNSGVILNQGLL